MSVGLGNIEFTGLNNPGTFPVGAADNGLSVDPVTGRIVLGNDVGGLSAQLLSDREIFSNDRDIIFRGSVADFATLFSRNGSTVGLTANSTDRVGAYTSFQALLQNTALPSELILTLISGFDGSDTPGVELNNGGAAVSRLQQVGDEFQIVQLGADVRRFLTIDSVAGLFQFGDLDVLLNGTNININDAASRITMGVDAGRTLLLDQAALLCLLGDIDSVFNNTLLTVDYSNGNTRVQIDAANGLRIVGDTVMLHTGTAWGDGAAANVGTLTNAPSAGDPTKWIPVDDNGTTRFIPAW